MKYCKWKWRVVRNKTLKNQMEVKLVRGLGVGESQWTMNSQSEFILSAARWTHQGPLGGDSTQLVKKRKIHLTSKLEGENLCACQNCCPVIVQLLLFVKNARLPRLHHVQVLRSLTGDCKRFTYKQPKCTRITRKFVKVMFPCNLNN